MLLHRRGHIFGFAIVARVIGPGDALHIGKLQHHLRAQVGFAQQACTLCIRRVAAQQTSELPRQPRYAL